MKIINLLITVLFILSFGSYSYAVDTSDDNLKPNQTDTQMEAGVKKMDSTGKVCHDCAQDSAIALTDNSDNNGPAKAVGTGPSGDSKTQETNQ